MRLYFRISLTCSREFRNTFPSRGIESLYSCRVYAPQIIVYNWPLCCYAGVSMVIDSGDSKPLAALSRTQRLLKPDTPLSGDHRYENGDLGLVPRASQHLCTTSDTVRCLSATLSCQMVGRIISRNVATQTPQSWIQLRKLWTVSSNSSGILWDNYSRFFYP